MKIGQLICMLSCFFLMLSYVRVVISADSSKSPHVLPEVPQRGQLNWVLMPQKWEADEADTHNNLSLTEKIPGHFYLQEP